MDETRPRTIGQCDATDAAGRPCILVTAHAIPHAADRAYSWTFPALPTLAPRAPGEPATYYGARALRFLLAHGVTATLDDETLELATYAAGRACSARNVDPAALAQCNELRHQIAAALKGRRQDATQAAQEAPRRDDRPNEGPMARLQPAPRTQPPGGVALRERANTF